MINYRQWTETSLNDRADIRVKGVKYTVFCDKVTGQFAVGKGYDIVSENHASLLDAVTALLNGLHQKEG